MADRQTRVAHLRDAIGATTEESTREAVKRAIAERGSDAVEAEVRQVLIDELLGFVREEIARELGKRRLMSYQGVHSRALSYRKGDAVTWDGSLWCALRDNENEKPPGDAWILVAKGGH